MLTNSLPLDPSLPAYTAADVPPSLGTRRQWKSRRRQVRTHQQPVGRLRWTEWVVSEVECQENDGSVTSWTEKRLAQRECGLFNRDQTAPYRGSRRTWAATIFWQYFVRFTSQEHYLWWVDEPWDGGKPRWLTCSGRLHEDHLKSHLAGRARYGVRGGRRTRFGGIDLDLHGGDTGVFLDQLRVLLEEFHGREGWHYQVANQNAGGVHLLQTFRRPVPLAHYLDRLRQRLRDLDRRHPDLAARARAAGMRSLGELEIFPDTQKGFRLPLCRGRTMLLDRPLNLVYDKRRKREVPDVIGYASWLSRDAKVYMPAQEVFEFVRARLRAPEPKPATAQEAVADKSKPKAARGQTGGLGSLGRMKGRYAQVLADFWSGRLVVADTLNTGIRLLALPLPYYLRDEEEAIALIEKYLDELPDCSFSDRLSGGDRAEVSRIVRNTVRQVYDGNGGQPDPDLSSVKLSATVKAWKRRGFNPTDKGTWDRAGSAQPLVLAKDFCWRPEEVVQLGRLQRLLKVSLHVASEAVKQFLRLVKGHRGEMAVAFVKNFLEGCCIRCGHHGKANKLLTLLRRWDWIRVTAAERWHPREEGRKGRARTYAIGEALAHKFEEKQPRKSAVESGARGEAVLRLLAGHSVKGEEKDMNLSFTSHRFPPDRPKPRDGLPRPPTRALPLRLCDVERNKGSP
jgi:hypothetical protein